MNLVSEAYIAKAIGINEYETAMHDYLNMANNDLVEPRYLIIKELLS